jgi:hypothetical protein
MIFCAPPARAAVAAAMTALLIATTLQSHAGAHVGSPDVFVEGDAGPYRLFVTVRPPHAIPGVADVEVLMVSDAVREVHIVPLPLSGDGAKFAPVPDRAVRSSDDPKLFTGHLWMMGAGAWQVRITVSGDRGEGTIAVPVPTLPQSTLGMTPARKAILFGFMLLLGAGFIGIISAMAREARLGAGELLDARARRRGRIAGAIATAVVIGVAFLGNLWWGAEATAYDRYVYKPLTATPRIAADSTLTLTITDPGWIGSRRTDDFVADHGHLMHLFILSPQLDRLFHLHPDELRAGVFEQRLPPMPPGKYAMFGDLVHATGVSETVTGQIEATGLAGVPLSGDDSGWSSSDSGGTKIVWVRDTAPLVPKRLTTFTFRVDDANGQPVTDLELYMGMPGHAVFVRRDLQVFAHVHPSGSAPMAALDIAMPATSSHSQHASLPRRSLGEGGPSTVTFPYGFPEPGQYRIFVQVKRAGSIVTGAFDADVK